MSNYHINREKLFFPCVPHSMCCLLLVQTWMKARLEECKENSQLCWLFLTWPDTLFLEFIFSRYPDFSLNPVSIEKRMFQPPLTFRAISYSHLPWSENNLQCDLTTTLPFHMLYARNPVNANKSSSFQIADTRTHCVPAYHLYNLWCFITWVIPFQKEQFVTVLDYVSKNKSLYSQTRVLTSLQNFKFIARDKEEIYLPQI